MLKGQQEYQFQEEAEACIQHRWGILCERLEIQGTELEDLAFAWLYHNYSSSTRAYHTLEHIDDCLARLDDFVQDPTNKAFVDTYIDFNALMVAIWFHDAVYIPTSKVNERESADMVLVCLSGDLVDFHVAERAEALIMTTVHDPKFVPTNITTELMLDIDLASLGYSKEKFDENSENIRKEYLFVEENAYRDARVKILKGFLARPRIYHTDWFFNRYEKQARENLTREIARLSETWSWCD